MKNNIQIQKATSKDQDSIWQIIKAVISTGDTYVFAPDSPRDKIMNYWCGDDKYTYVATIDDEIVGTFIIKDNFQDLGAHVANASYIVSPTVFGKGIGRTMGAFSLEEAKRLGYLAMQFNIVVKSNERAVQLWQKLGFEIIGEVPDAFNHQRDGLTNTLIMWRRL